MSDICFEDFDYDREDDLHSQAAELEEEKLTIDNTTKVETVVQQCHAYTEHTCDHRCENCKEYF